MEQPPRPRPPQLAIAALMATVFTVIAIAPANADSDDGSPFGDAPQLADAALDTMRGGFSGADGSMLRFAVNLQTVVDGQLVASLTIGNDGQGTIHASAQNLGGAVVLQPGGHIQLTSTPAQGSVTMQQNGTSAVTVQVANPSSLITTTLTPTLPSTISPGAVLAMTGLLPNGNGVVTLIQNTQSNVVINAVQNLNVQLSGVGTALLRASTAFQGFADSMKFSVHR